MVVPKHPFLAFVFILNFLIACFSKGLADSLRRQPEWIGIVIGLILFMLAYGEGHSKKGKSYAFPKHTIPQTCVIFVIGTALWWGGLLMAAAAPSRGLIYGIGLTLSASAVLVSIGWAYVCKRT